ncbi:hypothetical protein B296_00006674 [Ensete ventricosum]|uniref:Protein BPS1, chloroplastic n=1 Tax=Ensete ventricosum TaxID=4639 RepID=A0A426Y930_ENSVE|nr:hypothetical protein B296_00006674 [Ensete ventricosum]
MGRVSILRHLYPIRVAVRRVLIWAPYRPCFRTRNDSHIKLNLRSSSNLAGLSTHGSVSMVTWSGLLKTLIDILVFSSLYIEQNFKMTLCQSSQSLKIRELLFSFEQGLAENLKKLKPKDASDVLTLSWMSLAMDFLLDAHNSIKTFINELRLPVSDWDEKWISIYLDSSVKLLDVCIALSSELSRLDQGQLLLQYVLHLTGISASYPSSEQLVRAHSYIHEWIEHISKSPKLDNFAAIVESLHQGTLDLPKGKSSKAKALMRALYGVKVMTVFICAIFSASLSGCSRALIDLHVSADFHWFEAVCDLQAIVKEEIKRKVVGGKLVLFKEIEAVKICALRLHDLANHVSCKEEPVQDTRGINREDKVPERWRLQDCVTNLNGTAKKLGHELGSLSNQANDFFQIILMGRDALLCNLRVSAVTRQQY